MHHEDEYEQGRRLGEGGYGVVYSVTHIPTGEQFALKRIPFRQSDEGIPQSVLREVATLKSLEHPNIVR